MTFDFKPSLSNNGRDGFLFIIKNSVGKKYSFGYYRMKI